MQDLTQFFDFLSTELTYRACSMLSIVISALLSGLLGSFLTTIWASRETKRKDKLEILTILLSFRGRTDVFALSQISPAINRIPVIFAECPNIQSKMKEFIKIRNVFDLDKKQQKSSNI
ncbi:TPA: hypothetical protein ACSP15_003980 [Aeromonas veronii]